MTWTAEHTQATKRCGPLTLLAEDDDELRATVAALLRATGLRVLAVANGNQLRRAFHDEPDAGLIVTDIDMPGQNGLLAIQAIRQHDRDIPIVVISAYAASDPIVVAAMRVGASAVLAKPFDLSQLRETVDAFFENDVAQPKSSA